MAFRGGVAAHAVDWRATVLLLLLIRVCITVSSDHEVVDELEFPQLSIEEDMELERQVMLLNKPAVKSIESGYGDIFDCVDIYKQPAFDHPLLKNHTIQPIPAYFSERRKKDSTTAAQPRFRFMKEDCPSGTVPIRRTRKESIIGARIFKPIYYERYFDNGQSPNPADPRITYHIATYAGPFDYHGGRGHINVYGVPDVNPNDRQFSAAGFALSNDKGPLEVVQSGWIINHALYGDNNTRFYIYWTTDAYKSVGCYDLMCPGFVLVNSSIPVGAYIEPMSTYGGQQYEIILEIYKDRLNGNWWLAFEGEPVGYWPRTVFNTLQDHANDLRMGGLVGYTQDVQGPAMGNGHFENTGPYPCYIKGIATVDEQDKDHEISDGHDWQTRLTKHECFKLSSFLNHEFYFGGPPGCPP